MIYARAAPPEVPMPDQDPDRSHGRADAPATEASPPPIGPAGDHSNADGDPGATDGPTPADSIEARLIQLEADLAQEQDRRLRALAELQNYRRRAMEERAQQLQFANERLLADLVPVIDHFEMATEAAEASESARAVCRGYEMILAQLREVAARYGMSELPSEPGSRFDPATHEAVQRVEGADVPDGTIVRVVRKGYALHDRVLRPAQVAVAVQPNRA
jgi:molecular chaperone GrpE